MNIIISSLDGKIEIRKTGVSKDIDSAKLFISTAIENQDSLLSSITLTINKENKTYCYYLTAIHSESLDKKEYKGYFLISDDYIPTEKEKGEIYTLNIGKEPYSIDLTLKNDNKLIDQHNPILIHDR